MKDLYMFAFYMFLNAPAHVKKKEKRNPTFIRRGMK